MNGLPENQELMSAQNAIVRIGIESGKYKEIPLTKGKVTVVDAEDYEWLNQCKWCAQGRYAVHSGTGHLKMHRIILKIEYDSSILCDHINRNTFDNRKENLRKVGYSINGWNCKMKSNNTSGYRGVCLFKNASVNKWQADIRVNGKPIYLGRYPTAIEAALAYDKAAMKFRGKTSPLNFPKIRS